MPNKKICNPKTDYETNNHLPCPTKKYVVQKQTTKQIITCRSQKKICSPKTDYKMALLGSHPHGSTAPVPWAPVPTSSVPMAPVPTAPIPTAPVPKAPIPTAPVPMAPVPTVLVHKLPSKFCYSHAPVPHVLFPHAPVSHAPVPMLPSLKINRFNHTKTNHFNHTIKKLTPVLILWSTFSGISRTFTIFMLEAMWCEGSNPHGVEAL